MASSTKPLTLTEQEILLRFLDEIERGDPWISCRSGSVKFAVKGKFAARAVKFFFYIGAHPEVLAHGDKWDLRLDDDTIVWTRPKNRLLMRFPTPPQLAPWIRDFLGHLDERSTKWYQVLCLSVGRCCGIEGLTPRTLRHTAIFNGVRWVPQRGGDLNDCRRLFGCTMDVLLSYSLSQETPIDEKIRREGISPIR